MRHFTCVFIVLFWIQWSIYTEKRFVVGHVHFCLFSFLYLCTCLWFVYFQFIYVHSYGLFIFNLFMCMFVVLYVLKCAHVSLFTTCCIILNVFQVYINIVILVYPLYYHFLGVSGLLFSMVSLNVNAAFIFESLTLNYQQHYLKESYQRYVGVYIKNWKYK